MIRSFKVRDCIVAKKYLDKNKRWQFETVIEKLGSLHYSIKLNDRRIWK